jgi:uncharacterized membrane protein YdjX (TVP38/TMEM64 family)
MNRARGILLGLLIAGAAIALAIHRDHLDPAFIEATVAGLGPWAPIAHVLLFTLATVLFVPGAILGMAGGVLFGPLWGTIFNLIGATLGATASFLVARYVASDWVRRKAGKRLQRLISGVEEEGWRFVAFTRLVPLFPFNLLNYALGLTRISLSDYVLASLICMLPGTLAFTWLAYAGREALAGHDTAIHYGLLALALLATIAFLPRIVRRIRGKKPFRWMDVSELSGEIAHRGARCARDRRVRGSARPYPRRSEPSRGRASAAAAGAWRSAEPARCAGLPDRQAIFQRSCPASGRGIP